MVIFHSFLYVYQRVLRLHPPLLRQCWMTFAAVFHLMVISSLKNRWGKAHLSKSLAICECQPSWQHVGYPTIEIRQLGVTRVVLFLIWYYSHFFANHVGGWRLSLLATLQRFHLSVVGCSDLLVIICTTWWLDPNTIDPSKGDGHQSRSHFCWNIPWYQWPEKKIRNPFHLIFRGILVAISVWVCEKMMHIAICGQFTSEKDDKPTDLGIFWPKVLNK